MQGMRVAAEPPFRTSLCYRVHHDTEWHPLKRTHEKTADLLDFVQMREGGVPCPSFLAHLHKCIFGQ